MIKYLKLRYKVNDLDDITNEYDLDHIMNEYDHNKEYKYVYINTWNTEVLEDMKKLKRRKWEIMTDSSNQSVCSMKKDRGNE